MLLAPTVHCTLPFGNDLCSVELLGPVVLEQHGTLGSARENSYLMVFPG